MQILLGSRYTNCFEMVLQSIQLRIRIPVAAGRTFLCARGLKFRPRSRGGSLEWWEKVFRTRQRNSSVRFMFLFRFRCSIKPKAQVSAKTGLEFNAGKFLACVPRSIVSLGDRNSDINERSTSVDFRKVLMLKQICKAGICVKAKQFQLVQKANDRTAAEFEDVVCSRALDVITDFFKAGVAVSLDRMTMKAHFLSHESNFFII
mmetsp:Transcript_50116/g.144382  ORF Transcript_50116/g.144382 Transcript_50116/m.144382 type:complete len:204 (+) Transcript_50116:146-757(+)